MRTHTKWDKDKIKQSLLDFIQLNNLNHFPTHSDLRDNNSGLSRAIYLNGGTEFWQKEIGLPFKEKELKWTEEKIKEEIYNSVKFLMINKMPTSVQLKDIGKSGLHSAISRDIGYRAWAEKLNLELQDSETKLGQDYEFIGIEKLEKLGYKVENMTTGFPFDLYVNNSVSIDVKCGCAYDLRGSRVHTFGINKLVPTSDLYLIFALDESGEKIERTFVIPSHHIPMKSLNMGANSKYNKYINRFDYIDKYIEFKKSIK